MSADAASPPEPDERQTMEQAPPARARWSMPHLLLRLEGLALLAAAVALYWQRGGPWWLFLVLLLAPDLSFVGFAFGKAAGTTAYNVAHTTVLPLLLALVGLGAGLPVAVQVALVWLAHIGMDRTLGFGLLYRDGASRSHFERV
jgi:hypothetical protein